MDETAGTSETAETFREDDVLAISHTMTRMRLMVGRRVIGRRAIAKVSSGLELSHLDVLDVITRSSGDMTIGAVADAMRIDPSRASRIVADMVELDLLRRDVSQQDGRRSVINTTPQGQSILSDMHDAKIGIIREVLQDWPDEDVTHFARLYDRFIDSFEKRLT